MTDFLLYGLDAAGEAIFCEQLNGAERAALSDIARTRLANWHGVEIWDGPLCVLRMRRRKPHN